MLNKQFRLPARQKFIQSSFFKTPDFVLRVARNNMPYSRFGFIVRKAVDKRAVVRNRIRRVLRSCIEEKSQDIKDGYDMLFLLEKGIIDRKQEDICRDLDMLLSGKGLLK